ncbi:Amidase [Penicillium canariense]|uniref:amidase n=1 Tax=Penicillium canariense TaxID=189055 RepID=A0A9W9I8H1_9EURO|nr:Amidase [Penicillium canariense]KAJ5168763.1 Amidase [Penicillium canariense]
MASNSTWRAQAEAKRQSILDAIPEKWRLATPVPSATEVRDVTGSYIQQFLSKREIEITESDAVDIAAQTTTGRWSAVEVTEAFCHRAALAHQLVSCLHEVFFDAAIEDAKKLDAYFAEHKKAVGPLHGLPVSLKDQFHIKGIDTTMGYVGWIGTFQGEKEDPRFGTKESELVRELRNLGAVLYCKTSVPTTLMAGETVNNIIGYTWNPKNRLLSSGGSSGGEGALMALRGSPAGFGTDIGGSIRIPAGFNHLYGLRPSSGRMPYEGAANSMDGQSTVLSVIGPLAPTARSLTLLFKAVLSQQPWYHDPLVLELPWRDAIVEETRSLIEQAKAGNSTLAFAIMHWNGVDRVHPPIARGLKLVEQALQKMGHRVIPWNPPSHTTADQLLFKTFFMDGGVDIKHHFGLSGEPKASQVLIVEDGIELSVSQLAELNVAKREYQKQYLDYWNSTAELTGTGRPVDGIFCPIAPHAAIIPNQFGAVGYTGFVNVLDYPSVSIPVTFADKTIDVRPTNPSAALEEHIEWNYDADTYDGAPVGVQFVGRRLQEEKILTLTEYLGEEISRAVGAK